MHMRGRSCGDCGASAVLHIPFNLSLFAGLKSSRAGPSSLPLPLLSSWEERDGKMPRAKVSYLDFTWSWHDSLAQILHKSRRLRYEETFQSLSEVCTPAGVL